MIGRFEKVSYETFRDGIVDCLLNSGGVIPNAEQFTKIREAYDSIKLPTRATDGSAGYDFYLPIPNIIIDDAVLHEDEFLQYPLGVRWVGCTEDVALFMFPRSGLGFKYGMFLYNGTGIIDKDYCNADNEGQINIKFGVRRNMPITPNMRIAQGVFLPYYVTDNDGGQPKQKRTGGLGSTGVL